MLQGQLDLGRKAEYTLFSLLSLPLFPQHSLLCADSLGCLYIFALYAHFTGDGDRTLVSTGSMAVGVWQLSSNA